MTELETILSEAFQTVSQQFEQEQVQQKELVENLSQDVQKLCSHVMELTDAYNRLADAWIEE